MNITVIQQEQGLNDPEVWVKIESNSLVDWPTAKSHLSESQRNTLASAELVPCAYYPDSRTAAERTESGFEFEDFFVFRVRN